MSNIRLGFDILVLFHLSSQNGVYSQLRSLVDCFQFQQRLLQLSNLGMRYKIFWGLAEDLWSLVVL